VRESNFIKLVEDIIDAQQVFSEFRYIAAFSNAGGLIRVMPK